MAMGKEGWKVLKLNFEVYVSVEFIITDYGGILHIPPMYSHTFKMCSLWVLIKV